jgi:hypothetical protein
MGDGRPLPPLIESGGGGWCVVRRTDGRTTWRRLFLARSPVTDWLFIVEGEAKADLVWSWNVAATCGAGGGGKKWKLEHSEFLRGADIVLLPDNDNAGWEHFNVVGLSLAGIAKRVRRKGRKQKYCSRRYRRRDFWDRLALAKISAVVSDDAGRSTAPQKSSSNVNGLGRQKSQRTGFGKAPLNLLGGGSWYWPGTPTLDAVVREKIRRTEIEGRLVQLAPAAAPMTAPARTTLIDRGTAPRAAKNVVSVRSPVMTSAGDTS